MAYGLSFVYGVDRHHRRCAAIAAALAARASAAAARAGPGAGRARLQDRRVPVPHVGARHLRGGEHAVRGLAVGGAQGGGLRRDLPPLPRGRGRARCCSGCRVAAGLAAVTIVGRQPDGDPAAEHQAAARLLRHRAHRLHADRASPRSRPTASRWCSSTWSPTSSGTWARSWWSRRWRRPRAPRASPRIAGLAQRSPLLALAMLLFLLSLGGIPFVAGFWAKLYVFWAAAEQGLYWLVLLGAVLTVVALFYYLLVAKRMYIDAPERRDPVPVAPLAELLASSSACSVVVSASVSEAARRGRPPGREPSPRPPSGAKTVAPPRSVEKRRHSARSPGAILAKLLLYTTWAMPALPVGKLPPQLLQRLLSAHAVRRSARGRGAAGRRGRRRHRHRRPLPGRDRRSHHVRDRRARAGTRCTSTPTTSRCAAPGRAGSSPPCCCPRAARPRRGVERCSPSSREACAELGVALVGGHTEVTAGLDARRSWPACMLGEVAKDRLVTTGGRAVGRRAAPDQGRAARGRGDHRARERGRGCARAACRPT